MRLASPARMRLVTLSRNKQIFVPSRFPFKISTGAKENGRSGSSRAKTTQELSIRKSAADFFGNPIQTVHAFADIANAANKAANVMQNVQRAFLVDDMMD